MNSIEYLFVPYTESLELKQLGFDEPCLAHYVVSTQTMSKGKISLHIGRLDYDDIYKEYALENIPTFSQAFRWFREKYGLHSTITSISQESWQWHITKSGESLGKLYDEDFYTYEEAELTCLRKLIEIVKNGKS